MFLLTVFVVIRCSSVSKSGYVDVICYHIFLWAICIKEFKKILGRVAKKSGAQPRF